MNNIKNDAIINTIMNNLGNTATIEIKEIDKNNGNKRIGVCICEEGSNVTSVVYIDDMLDYSAEEIANAVLERYKGNSFSGTIDVNKIFTKEYILDNVIIQVINKDKNTEIISKAPSYDFLDLACIFRIKFDALMGSAIITNDIMANTKLTINELKAAAKNNIRKEHYKIRSMFDVLGSLGFEDIEKVEDCPLYVLTNESGTFGANIMLRKELLAKLAKKLGGDLYILPSSIHEVLAMKKTPDRTSAELRALVRSVNDTEVKPEEVLSYNVYVYSLSTNTIEVAV